MFIMDADEIFLADVRSKLQFARRAYPVLDKAKLKVATTQAAMDLFDKPLPEIRDAAVFVACLALRLAVEKET